MITKTIMGKLPLHKRVLEWLTSHALWELAKYLVGAALSAGLVSVGVSRIFHAALGTALNIFLVLMGVMGMLWMSGVVRWSKSTTSKEEEAKWDIYFFSPGLPVSLTPSIGRVIISLNFLSTKATELIFLHVTLRNITTKAHTSTSTAVSQSQSNRCRLLRSCSIRNFRQRSYQHLRKARWSIWTATPSFGMAIQ